MKEKLSASKSAALVPIRRGGAINGQRYLITSGRLNSIQTTAPDLPIILWLDERIIEYDIDRVVVDHQSQFQRIQIFHTLNYGNILVLDENQSTIYYFLLLLYPDNVLNFNITQLNQLVVWNVGSLPLIRTFY